MRQPIHSDTGLTMFPMGDTWGIGYRPTRATLCIGTFSTCGLTDAFNDNEVVFIRFVVNENGLVPKQFYPECADPKDNYSLQKNEVRVSIGNTFTVPYGFSTGTIS